MRRGGNNGPAEAKTIELTYPFSPVFLRLARELAGENQRLVGHRVIHSRIRGSLQRRARPPALSGDANTICWDFGGWCRRYEENQ
jgi:hypothetical protein